jgi:hypothetical protein
MAASPSEPMAARRLTLVPSGRPVLVELDAPLGGRGAGWDCAWRVRGLGRTRAGRARGEDSLHALQLALDAVRRELEPFGARLTWTGEPGEVGLPVCVPDYFGGAFRQRLERLVQLETEREARRLKVPEQR